MLALMGQEKFTDVANAEIQPELPIALGVIRDVEAETYDEAVRNQINAVQEKSKVKSFDELLMTLEHWDI
jgi:2-oxoglutarate ferredoxin oxidoreductase subunit beta